MYRQMYRWALIRMHTNGSGVVCCNAPTNTHTTMVINELMQMLAAFTHKLGVCRKKLFQCCIIYIYVGGGFSSCFCLFCLSLSLDFHSAPLSQGKKVLMNSNGFVYSNMNLHDSFGTQIVSTNHKNCDHKRAVLNMFTIHFNKPWIPR